MADLPGVAGAREGGTVHDDASADASADGDGEHGALAGCGLCAGFSDPGGAGVVHYHNAAADHHSQHRRDVHRVKAGHDPKVRSQLRQLKALGIDVTVNPAAA